MLVHIERVNLSVTKNKHDNNPPFDWPVNGAKTKLGLQKFLKTHTKKINFNAKNVLNMVSK